MHRRDFHFVAHLFAILFLANGPFAPAGTTNHVDPFTHLPDVATPHDVTTEISVNGSIVEATALEDAIGPIEWDAKPMTMATNEPPVPFGWYPPAATMGGLPPVPPMISGPDNLHDTIVANTTVRLRGGGIFRPYGLARGDIDVATHLFNDIQNPFFVLPNDPTFTTGPGTVPVRPNSTNYSLYPRLTRVGLEYYGLPIPRLNCAVPSTRVEVDFLTNNPGGLESRELLRLRLGYAQVKGDEWTLLAGQDWDIVSPLIPSINDNTLQWNNGNTGDRRPQVKLLRDHEMNNGWIWQFQNGIGLGDAINGIDRDGDGVRDNEYSGLPVYQGRIGFMGPSRVKDKKFIAGMWSLVGDQETNLPIAGERDFLLWGYGFDLQLPLTHHFMFRGEVFQGSNLDDFRGGIQQGVNVATGDTIDTAGGWAEIVYQPIDCLLFSLGFSMDDPRNADIPLGGRTLNHSWYIGSRYLAGRGLMFGADFQDWTTEWNGFVDGHAILVKTFVQQAF